MIIQPLDPKTLGQRVQTERKARGMTQSELANLLGVARTTLTAVEKGERPLSSAEIMQLSKLWDISVTDLVRPRPIAEPLAPQLRAAVPQSGLTDDDIEDVAGVSEKMRQLGEYYLELEKLSGKPLPTVYPPVYTVSSMPIDDAAADIAARERNRLGLGEGPLPHLRSILENDVGLRIFLLPMPSRIAGMFAYNAQLGGCIAINVAHPVERRLWTLAHEFYHFLCDRYSADICTLPGAAPRRLSENERLADAFAAHFLMPETGLRRRFYDLKAAKSDGVMPGDLLQLKRQYGVAFQALTLRLEELKLLRSGTWKYLREAGFHVREAEAMVGLPPRQDHEERMPLRYRLLAVEAYDRSAISEGQLKRFLDCDRTEARRIVNDLSSELLISDEGSFGELDIMPGEPLAHIG